jgi:hypothetical protein
MMERNIHHQGKIPSRTFVSAVERSKIDGKWSTSFETWRGVPGQEYMVHRATSASLFETEDAAYAAGDRALDLLQQSDRFPNMCEVW